MRNAEAAKLELPVVGICDTNSDPTKVRFPIPCNDDAIKALQLMADYFKEAIEAGRAKLKTPEKTAE